MTAQQLPSDDRPADLIEDQADPIGPITMPKRTLIGARTYALVGAVGVFAAGAIELVDNCPTWPTNTISYY